MISAKMTALINEQIKNELESAYLYYAMAAWFAQEGWEGMANWMKVQTREEMLHADKFFDYLNERGNQVELQPLGLKKTRWNSPLEAFRDALEHEYFITSRINALMSLAVAENDYGSKILLDWFVNEQIEEESSAARIVQLLERVGDSGHGLMMIDRELGTRVFTPPATGE